MRQGPERAKQSREGGGEWSGRGRGSPREKEGVRGACTQRCFLDLASPWMPFPPQQQHGWPCALCPACWGFQSSGPRTSSERCPDRCQGPEASQKATPPSPAWGCYPALTPSPALCTPLPPAPSVPSFMPSPSAARAAVTWKTGGLVFLPSCVSLG